jgi:peptidoglycan/xylan/chitin deacetylase (PgdA/CDA1 family)
MLRWVSPWEVRSQHLKSKRHQLASFFARTGVIRLLEGLPRRSCIIVLNYHRIGSPADSLGDPEMFSATADDFDSQVSWIKRHYDVATLEEVVGWVHGRERFRGTRVLFTFDDGYRDNYLLAYPTLRSHGVQGTFFLCTSFLDDAGLPWWDRIAYTLKQTRMATLTLSYPRRLTLEARALPTLNQLLSIYKNEPELNKAHFLDHLADATEVLVPTFGGMFVNRAEALEMHAGGMAIGSHTHSHELLSHLSPAAQLEELTTSKRILEDALGIPVNTLAYPVGSPTSFDDITFAALRQVGYEVAFSYYGGVAVPGVHMYDVPRQSVDAETDGPLFRLRTAVAAVTTKGLI